MVVAVTRAQPLLFRQLRQILGRVSVELLDAGLAAEFDLLVIVNLGDGSSLPLTRQFLSG
jgi:hypothetical protein